MILVKWYYQMYIHTPEVVVLSAVPQMASLLGDLI